MKKFLIEPDKQIYIPLGGLLSFVFMLSLSIKIEASNFLGFTLACLFPVFLSLFFYRFSLLKIYYRYNKFKKMSETEIKYHFGSVMLHILSMDRPQEVMKLFQNIPCSYQNMNECLSSINDMVYDKYCPQWRDICEYHFVLFGDDIKNTYISRIESKFPHLISNFNQFIKSEELINGYKFYEFHKFISTGKLSK